MCLCGATRFLLLIIPLPKGRDIRDGCDSSCHLKVMSNVAFPLGFLCSVSLAGHSHVPSPTHVVHLLSFFYQFRPAESSSGDYLQK